MAYLFVCSNNMHRKIKLIEALRSAAAEITHSPHYQWGHMGSCNCGFLAQKLTGLTRAEIHAFALQKQGDWADQLNDYCPGSGYPMDRLIFDLLQHGLSRTGLSQLERLSNPAVRDAVKQKHGLENLSCNKAEDTAVYMKAWAGLLEEELLEEINVEDIPENLSLC